MTQEQKARRYDEAVKAAKQIHEYSSDLAEIERMEDIFPELKESEDEKIIKWLIEDIKDTLSSNNMPNDYKDMAEKAIAWLKKQGKNGDMKEMQGEQQSSASTLTQEEVQKLHDHLEMHKQLPKSEPQTITFTDSGTMQVIDKLNEIIGKLGDIHEVLSKPSIYPYEPIITTRPYYTPPSPVPGMDVWYKTHGVEKVTPVTCETTNGFNKSENNESNN